MMQFNPHKTDFPREVAKDAGSRRLGSRSAGSIDPEAPLRLEDAIKVAFPLGGMTVSGLRREIARGRLVVEEIAGKQFTTLANIKRMRELCRVEAKVQGFSSRQHVEMRKANSPTEPPGSSATMAAMSAQDAVRMKLARLNKS
jgi:hypothetical protein